MISILKQAVEDEKRALLRAAGRAWTDQDPRKAWRAEKVASAGAGK